MRPDIDGILAGGFGRGDVALVGAVIEDDDPGRVLQRRARLRLGDRPLDSTLTRLGVADEHRHPHASRADGDVRVEDLAVSTAIFHSFLGRPVIHEHNRYGE